ncbi:hypothetical protein [Rickettsia rickettsii]|uniref:hypothetical protein n=1 Tax=Rickettsia rickettsii TaxID=783 RepID=UPI00376EC8D7
MLKIIQKKIYIIILFYIISVDKDDEKYYKIYIPASDNNYIAVKEKFLICI